MVAAPLLSSHKLGRPPGLEIRRPKTTGTPSHQPCQPSPTPQTDTIGRPPGLETRKPETGTPQHQPSRPSTTPTPPLRNSHQDLNIVSYNIRGAKGSLDPDRRTRDLSKLETLARLMKEQNIDVLLLQETWLIGDITTTICGILVHHHGPPQATSNRGSAGLAILMGPRAQKAWHDAGSPPPYRLGVITPDGNPRYMGIELLFRPRRNQRTRLFIGNIYAPHQDLEKDHPGIVERFFTQVDRHLRSLNSSTGIIVGGDFNATVGTRTTDCDAPTLGPYGIGKANDAGEHVLNLARSCSLRVANTYFKAKRYHTFRDWRTGHRRQLDYFLVSQRIARQVTDAKTYQPRNGIISDHVAVRLRFRLNRHLTTSHRQSPATHPADPTSKDTDLFQEHLNWRLLHQEPDCLDKFQDTLETILYEYVARTPEQSTPTQLSEAIMYAAQSAILEPKPTHDNWFDACEATVRPLREKARLAWDRYIEKNDATTRRCWQQS